jgi:hypothetical protein
LLTRDQQLPRRKPGQRFAQNLAVHPGDAQGESTLAEAAIVGQRAVDFAPQTREIVCFALFTSTLVSGTRGFLTQKPVQYGFAAV